MNRASTMTSASDLAQRRLSYPATTMAVWAPSLAAVYGDRPAVIDGDRVLTYNDLDARSAQFAGVLHEAGCGPATWCSCTSVTASSSTSPTTVRSASERRSRS